MDRRAVSADLVLISNRRGRRLRAVGAVAGGSVTCSRRHRVATECVAPQDVQLTRAPPRRSRSTRRPRRRGRPARRAGPAPAPRRRAARPRRPPAPARRWLPAWERPFRVALAGAVGPAVPTAGATDGVAVLGTPPTRTISASSAAACSVRAARSGSIRAATVGSAAMTAAANAASARAASARAISGSGRSSRSVVAPLQPATTVAAAGNASISCRTRRRSRVGRSPACATARDPGRRPAAVASFTTAHPARPVVTPGAIPWRTRRPGSGGLPRPPSPVPTHPPSTARRRADRPGVPTMSPPRSRTRSTPARSAQVRPGAPTDELRGLLEPVVTDAGFELDTLDVRSSGRRHTVRMVGRLGRRHRTWTTSRGSAAPPPTRSTATSTSSVGRTRWRSPRRAWTGR